MQDNNVFETEVLESVVPEELKVYLEKDDEVIEKLDTVIKGLEDDINSLNEERENSEKDFEKRLEEFKESLAKEKEELFNEYDKREIDITTHKVDIEKIKLEQQGKQVNYVETLKDITSKFDSKISSIEDAIKACEDNDTLTKALEEEKNKKLESLEDEYKNRKEELKGVLETIGEKEEPELEETTEEEYHIEEPELPSDEIDLDIDVNSVETPDITPTFETNYNAVEEDVDTEVVSHEPREDVINTIYESEDVMEGHVFPYLRSLV